MKGLRWSEEMHDAWKAKEAMRPQTPATTPTVPLPFVVADRFRPANEYVESIPTLTDIADAPTREDVGVETPSASILQTSAPQYETVINALCDSEGIPYPSYEYRFYALRRWRFDAAWPDSRCALEIEGGVWTGGRHTRGSGFVKDIEKYNAAVLQGWRVIRCLPDQLPAGVSQIAIMLTRAA